MTRCGVAPTDEQATPETQPGRREGGRPRPGVVFWASWRDFYCPNTPADLVRESQRLLGQNAIRTAGNNTRNASRSTRKNGRTEFFHLNYGFIDIPILVGTIKMSSSINKKYSDFMDEISSDELYEGLLAHGFFAEKLPPVFTAVPFFNYCKTASQNFKPKWSEYITFRVMRNIKIPRIMGIPNPFQYQILCARLRDNWDNLRKHFHTQTDGQRYRISRIHLKKTIRGDHIFEMNYKNWRVDGNPELDLLIHDQGTSRFLVNADISTCFPNIYTHSIPWALVGKSRSKKDKAPSIWYNSIDKACSTMRNGETHGLLIGPHASNLLSEIILTVVDKKLYDKGYRFIRHIDDYDCYVNSHDQAQVFLKDLEEALRDFDLNLNHKKTKIIELPIGIEKNWKHQLDDLPQTGPSGFVGYPQVNTFIDTALSLATETGDFAILNYAIKKLQNLELTASAKKLAAKRFIHLALLYPYLLHLMEEYVFIPYKVETSEIKDLSERILYDAVKLNDNESLCYAIYFSIRFNFSLDEFDKNRIEAQNYIINTKDCLLLIMTWIYFLNKNHGDTTALELFPLLLEANDLGRTDMDRYWLFCYEALPESLLEDSWQLMKSNGISFIRDGIIAKGNTPTI